MCVDECGRGALGGPATAGIVVIDATIQRALPGLRDSKLLTPSAREALAPKIRKWAAASAVGHASAGEVDAIGLTAALRLAGHRAMSKLAVQTDVVLLDGNYDWLSPPPQLDLLSQPSNEMMDVPDVITMIKADMTCSGVAAASILAKVERDAIMIAMARRHPDYGWERNKGYASSEHIDALRRLGPCEQHRKSWHLPSIEAQYQDANDS